MFHTKMIIHKLQTLVIDWWYACAMQRSQSDEAGVKKLHKLIWGVGKMRNCGMRNAESKMRNGPCGMHLIG